MAQLVRAPPCHGGGRRFESDSGRKELNKRGVSSAGRASVLQTEGHRFEPYTPHKGEFPSGQRGQTVNLLALPSVVRIHLPPSDTIYYTPMRLGAYAIYSSIAQSVEHAAVNRGVVGSSPTWGAERRWPFKDNFISSRDRAVWKLVGLITRRPQVQILLPQSFEICLFKRSMLW